MTQKQTWFLAAGDVLIFLYFSWSGKVSHHLPADLISVLYTSFPFLLSWFLVAPTCGLFRTTYSYLELWLRLGLAVPISTMLAVWFRAWMLGLPFNWLFFTISALALTLFFWIWRLGHLAWQRRRSTQG